MKKITLIFVILIGYAPISAQSPIDSSQTYKKRFFARASHHTGYILPTNGFLKGYNATELPYQFYDANNLEFGKQTTGERLWEQLYDRPAYGIGFSRFGFRDANNELGRPCAIYGFLVGPIRRFWRSSLNFEAGFGLSYNWNPYDPESNPFNDAIGSGNNVYINLGLHYNWQLSHRLELDAGLMFYHFSNGATTLPNGGVNLISPKLSLRYNFYKSTLNLPKFDIPNYTPENEFYVLTSFGVSNIKADSIRPVLDIQQVDKHYLMANISMFYQRQITWKLKLGGGIDLNYDGVVEADADLADGVWDESTLRPIDKMSVGIVGSVEWVIGDLSMIIQPGYEVLRNKVNGRRTRFYQRLGLKYHILPNTFVGVGVRAINFDESRFIEWNLGYRIKWRKHRH